MAGLSSFIAVLLQKLRSVLDSPAAGFEVEQKKSASSLKWLESVLKSISLVITDAEERQIHEEAVNSWLQSLEDAVYDAEDVVDEILYEISTSKLEAESQNLYSWTTIRSAFFSASIKQNTRPTRSIREIVEVIDALANDINKYEFRQLEARTELLPLSDSFPDDTTIYGREADMIKIIDLLLLGDENIDTIALVGKDGLGKTTLAQLVYNNDIVSAHFQLKAWIDAFTFSSFAELIKLQAKLFANLAGKRFLLVLDDVDVLEKSNSNGIESLLESGAKGSKIIVTTRSEEVAVYMGCSTRYCLDPLTVIDCWSIIAKSSFAGRDKSELEALEDIGWKIVVKCQGIPLCAKAIGGLLRFKKTREEWLHVLQDMRSFEEEDVSSLCLQLLRLSYKHLPAQLKRCFAYCSLFPFGYKFEKEDLVLLWMAEGFLEQFPTKSMELEVGAECFNSLLKRSFFISVDNSHFKMHDLVHDLAEFVSGRVYPRFESNSRMMEHEMRGRTRHLSFPRSQRDTLDNLRVILGKKRLRTFHLINSLSNQGSCQLSPEDLKAIFSCLQRLRVLSLPHFQYTELPASISKLKYLRYLDVSDSALKGLPESLCTLYHLQTLILTNCFYLVMLPQGIVKLINLQKLDIEGAGLKQMPKGMNRLKSLQSLSNFIVDNDGFNIKELGALTDLHGKLSISMLQNVSSIYDAWAANLRGMLYLYELDLEWSCSNGVSATRHVEVVLDNLKPSGELRKLSIRFYGGKNFPKWLGDSSLSKLTSLHLSVCKCESLPPLGQLSTLEHLTVSRIGGIKKIGHEFSGVYSSGCKPFQSLKTLMFMDLLQWEEWILPEVEGEEFPCLEEFYIIHCPVLKGGLPKSLPTLTKLEISNCEQLETSLPCTSKSCVLKLDNCSKVQKETQDMMRPKSEDEVASQFSLSTMTQIPGNEKQLEWSGNEKNPAKEYEDEVQEELDLSEKLKKPLFGSYGGNEFSKWLEIYELSKLTFLCVSDNNDCSSLPPFGQLPFLEHLIIQRMGGIRSIGPDFYRHEFPFEMPFQSLKTLTFEAMSQWEQWTPVEVDGEEFPSLQEFYLINCPKLKGDLPMCLSSLMKLEISECQELAALLPWTSKHCVLKLDNCDKVQKRSEDNQTVELQFSPSILQQQQDDNQRKASSSEDSTQQFSSSSLNVSSIGVAQSMELPNLQSLRIERYASSMLPKEILEISCLQHLYIIECFPLKIFPLSPSLKTLYIHNCKSLEFPQPDKVMNQISQLQDFCLGSSCDSLKIFPLNYFPKLKSLSLWDCRNLEYFSIEKQLPNELTSLEALEIKDCPNLKSFLEEEFHAPNLTSLVFFNCMSLKSLQRIQCFKSLQSLYINKCPALESLPSEGLPSSLIILCISFCDQVTPKKGWKLDRLHSLSHFEIEGGCLKLESFPEEGLLPTSLDSMRISKLSNLTSLDKEGLQKLTSLQTLEINCCNKLDSLPAPRLPSCLSSLSITDCSLLNPKLQNRKGKEWIKIAHIPSIQLDEVSD